MRRLIWLPLVILALLVVEARGSTTSAAGIEVRTSTAQNQFPNGIQFNISAVSNDTITSVRLRYRIIPDGVTNFVRAQCNTGVSVNCNVTVGNVGSVYMVPGAEVIYAWEVEDAAGQKFTSPDQTTVYHDARFQWQSISDRGLTVFFYSGTPQSNQIVLNTAAETISRFSTLLNTQIDYPLKVWVYATSADLQPAVASRRGQGPDSTVRTLGEVYASDTALVSRDSDFLNIVRHELAHVVTNNATRDHAAGIPTWINEGISTYAQDALLPDEASSLDIAIRRNTVLPITSLTASARGSADVVSLFYAQSGSIIEYLIDAHGSEKFASFIAGMKSDTTEGSLLKTYGLDTLGLENLWRQSVGLAPVELATPAASSNQQALPTLVPFGSNPGQSQVATPESGQSGSGQVTPDEEESDSNLIPVVAVIALLAVAVIFGVYLWRRRSQASG